MNQQIQIEKTNFIHSKNLKATYGRNGKILWPEWKKISDCTEEELTEYNLIQVPEDLLVIEYDSQEGNILSNNTLKILKKLGIAYEVYSHSGRSPHIHIKSEIPLLPEQKFFLIKKFGGEKADLRMGDKIRLMPVPNSPHWKYDRIYLLEDKSEGRKINSDDLKDFKEETIEKVITLNIINVAKSAGLEINSNNQAICPFHEDTNPSLTFYPETNTFYCFGCKITGNIFDFSKKFKKLNLDDPWIEMIKETYSKKPREGRALIVNKLLKEYVFLTLEDNKQCYFYENGIYKKNAEALIGKKTQEILGEEYNHIGNVKEVIEHIKRETYIKREHFKEPLNLICLENGIFNIDTMQLEDFSPNHIFLNKIPIKYDETADCPNIMAFLSEVVDLEDIPTIQEFIGYFFYKKMIFHKSIMFVGSGANGKSTLISLFKRLLGYENIVSEPLQKIESDKFSIANLYGKLANLVDELPKKSLEETSKFKQLTGGDSISAQFKFKDTFVFENYAKQIFAANQLPRINDDNFAFWRRWIMFKFEKVFDKSNADVNIISKLSTPKELSGLFNYAIEGLKRLLEQQEFTLNKSTEEIRQSWIRESDPVGAFCLDVVEETSQKEHIIKRDLYELFRDYCKEKGYECVPENYFHRRLQSKMKIYDTQLSINNDSGKVSHPHAWKGIKIRQSYERENKRKNKIR